MDANEVKKKFFDVTPPSSTAQKTTTKKRQLVVVDDSGSNEEATAVPSEFNESDSSPKTTIEVKREKVIEPPKSDESATTEVTNPEKVETDRPEVAEPTQVEDVETQKPPQELGVDPIPVDTNQPPEDIEKPISEPEDKDVPIANSYVAVDSLPDDNQKSADALKSDTQEPRLYDTKAYHIPIKETTHGHGTKSAFVFGTLFALVFVGGLVYVLAVIAK